MCVCAGIALRVPTPNVSVVDLVIQTEKKTFAEEVNEAFRDYAKGQGDVSPPPPSSRSVCPVSTYQNRAFLVYSWTEQRQVPLDWLAAARCV